MLLHQAVQCGLLVAMAFLLKPCAIRPPLGLPASGLHERLPRGDPAGLKPFSAPESP
jgi:hypothetical protein